MHNEPETPDELAKVLGEWFYIPLPAGQDQMGRRVAVAAAVIQAYEARIVSRIAEKVADWIVDAARRDGE